MRNFFSDGGWLAWEDESFVVGVYGEDGRFVPGRAAKWKAGEELMGKLEAVGLQEVQVPEVTGLEGKEEEKSTLYGHNQNQPHLNEPVTDQDDASKAPTTAESTPRTPEQGQSTSFLSLIDDFGLWVPLPRPRFAGYSTGNYKMAA